MSAQPGAVSPNGHDAGHVEPVMLLDSPEKPLQISASSTIKSLI